jgi:DNA-binding PadR family transcriptional regulator
MSYIVAWFRRRRENAEARVLAAIREANGEAYGLSIWRATGLGAGRVTRALYSLEQRGQIVAHWEADSGDRPPRRFYSVAP